MSTLTPIEHTAIGALAGVLEVSVMQPTVTVKNALQEGRALPRTPLAFYRGYLVGGISFAAVKASLSGSTDNMALLHRSMRGALRPSQQFNLVLTDSMSWL